MTGRKLFPIPRMVPSYPVNMYGIMKLAVLTQNGMLLIDAFQLLKKKGHRAVAFTTARMESNSTKNIIKAYHNVFGDIPSGYHISSCQCLEDGYKAANQFLQLSERPTAIYANGDEVASGIYLHAKAEKLNVPDDLAIIGQENQPVGIGLGLTTVDHQLTKIGEQACHLMINKLKEKIEIPYRIIERDSV